MIKLICSMVLLYSIPVFAAEPGIMEARSNYGKAVSDKMICKEQLHKLSKRMDDLSIGYLGAYQSIWATHIWNPLDKLDTFKKGKKNIERAISNSPENIEIRFIRLSVQQGTPSILKYKDNILSDKTFVLNHLQTVSDENLKKIICDFFEETDLLTPQEKLQLR